MEWYNDGLNLRTEFQQEKYDVIRDYAENNVKVLISKMDGDANAYGMSLKFGNSILKQFELMCLDSKLLKAIFAIGQLKGVIRACAHLDYEKKSDARVWKDTEKHYSSIKHLDKIIEYVDRRNGVSHTDLAEKLGMQPSTLTECMKRIAETNLIRDSRSGKYKIYTLSDDGRRYALSLKQKKKSLENNSDRLLPYMSRTLSNSDKYCVLDKTEPVRLKVGKDMSTKEMYKVQNIYGVYDENNKRFSVEVLRSLNEMDDSSAEFGERILCKQELKNY